MLYLKKNEDNIEVNQKTGKNLPYFTLLDVKETKESTPENRVLDWKNAKQIAAFWKVKSGKPGYTGRFQEGFEYNKEGIKTFTKKPNETVSTD